MKKEKKQLTADDELRLRAIERLKAKAPEATISRTHDETQRLLHELQVHQIELELQNEELRRARDDVETALEKYADLYDFAPVGYFTLERNGAIRAVNLAGATILGVERSRLLGRRFGQFVAVTARPAFTAFLQKVFESRFKDACEVALFKEVTLPHFVQLEAVATESATECHIAVIDVTERRRAENALMGREERFRIQVECVKNYAIFMLDVQGNVSNWNAGAERLKGYRAEEIIGKHFSCFYPEEDQAEGKPAEELKKAAAEGHVEEVGWRVRKDESRFWADVIITALHDGNGNLQGFSKVTHDITEPRQIEEKLETLHTDLVAHSTRLETANIELEAFNYTVSHDLRKPLTVINSYCQVIQKLRSDQLDEQSKGYIQEIYEATLCMDRLIDTLLKFSHITRVEVHHHKVDLSKIAEEVALRLNMSEPERRVTFRIAAGIVVDGDPDLLRVVLENLIGNAWKFSGNQEETVIEFAVTEVDGKPASFVRDNGPGFDMAFADKLFIPFQRLPGTNVDGHGIGLATVERIVRRHGGKVWAESEINAGSTFYVSLPVAKELSSE